MNNYSHLLTRCENVAPDPNISPDEQFEQWKTNLKVSCVHSLKVIKKLLVKRTEMRIPQHAIELSPQYFRCPSCTLKEIGVLPTSATCSFSTFQLEPAEVRPLFEICQNYANHPKGILVLIGSPGTGKSHLAISVLRETIRRFTPYPELQYFRPSSFFITHWQLLLALRSTYSKPWQITEDDAEEENALKRCEKAQLLVLDDLRRPVAQDDQMLIQQVLEHRIEHFKPTIITTNIRPTEFESALGTALFDRIRGAQSACLEFGFPSKRQALNAAYLDRCL